MEVIGAIVGGGRDQAGRQALLFYLAVEYPRLHRPCAPRTAEI